ncbi:MAG: hypothetical protein OEZ06_10525, partial [Myxococcales bacterium]|nr:hypothetical protein [Myxococcales bacterium]
MQHSTQSPKSRRPGPAQRLICALQALVFYFTLGTPLASRVQAQEADSEPLSVETVTQGDDRAAESRQVGGQDSSYDSDSSDFEAEEKQSHDPDAPTDAELTGDDAEAEEDPDATDAARSVQALPDGAPKSAVTPQAISLPKAEGSIEGMGESFTPNLSAGTGTFSVPIALPPGRAGVQPSLSLSYGTSGGNGMV